MFAAAVKGPMEPDPPSVPAVRFTGICRAVSTTSAPLPVLFSGPPLTHALEKVYVPDEFETVITSVACVPEMFTRLPLAKPESSNVT